MTSATEYWKKRFGKYPESDSEKLACAFAAEYGANLYDELKADKIAFAKHHCEEQAKAIIEDVYGKVYNEKSPPMFQQIRNAYPIDNIK